MTALAPVRHDGTPGTLRAGSLFSGVAGLDHAAAEVFGAEPAWFCDNDAAAQKVLAHHYPGVPVLGDITTVDWDQVEPVDLVTAGWPCQPWSTAGKRKGVEDERALWPEVARALRALRPGIVVLENVARIVAAGELERVANTLAALWYQFCWTVLGADEVGGCHRRNRCFILAVADADRERRQGAQALAPGPGRHQPDGGGCRTTTDSANDGRHEGRPEPTRFVRRSDAALGGGEAPSDAAGTRRQGHVAGASLAGDGAAEGVAGQVQPGGLDSAAAHAEGGRPARDDGSARSGPARGGGERIAVRDAGCSPSADTDGAGLEGREPAAGHELPAGGTDWGIYTAAIRRWERIIGRAAPVPRITGPRGGLKLNPALPEWMQGFPAGWITDVPGVTVNDALRLAGNSVCPYQAVAALRWLLAQLGTPSMAGEV